MPLLGTLSVGVLFGILEVMVSLVQAFVFFILITVYLEESISH
jgi:F0F1-type ATP synthase membrane subunit a